MRLISERESERRRRITFCLEGCARGMHFGHATDIRERVREEEEDLFTINR